MKTRPHHPYVQPLVRGFENKAFLKRSKIIFEFIRNSSLRRVYSVKDREWVHVSHERRPTPILNIKSNVWVPKLYICVSPKDYWAVVSDLISLTLRHKLYWKFCKNFKNFARPDKIVLYCKDLPDLKRCLHLIRPVLNGRKFHKLKFASKKGPGVYAGSDPRFLGTSWRFYRWAIGEAIIKENLKNGKLSREVREVLKKMNINLKNEGPLRLKPLRKNNKFIKKIWKEANS